MGFIDFQLRAWQIDGSRAQVMVHSSPVGGMRKPVVVPSDVDQLSALRQVASIAPFRGEPGTLKRIIEAGRQLSQILLPSPVFALLIRSLEHIEPEDGLRFRLCLDESLADLPWEFLYRPDAPTGKSLAGFLVLDSRISLVREAPIALYKVRPSRRKQRMLFAGTFWAGDVDAWCVREEYQRLSGALEPVQEFLAMDFCAASDDHMELALTKPATIFHYSGHTDVSDGRGYLMREVAVQGGVCRFDVSPKLYSETLAVLLRKARTRLAVFSACNSGRWAFVQPLVQAGLPALVGVQGTVSTLAASAFCRKLYSSLAIGLPLDEAVTWARFHIVEAGVSPGEESCEWGAFMVYMPAAEAILIPRPRTRAVRERQESARRERQQTIINVYQNIGSVQGGQVTGASVGQISGH